MIVWVYERARQAPCLDRLVVATDSEEIVAACRQYAIPATMTSSAHHSGTDRIIEVMTREIADIYVNIQGDEPMITSEHLELLLRPFRDAPGTQVSTLKVAIDLQSARDPNNVKVVTDVRGQALYFSRALIPSDREGTNRARYYKHLGLYAYTRSALEKYSNHPPSTLEQLEKLEQLRFLENGIPIAVMETLEDTVGVDTEEDLLKVEEYFRQSGLEMPKVKQK
jgi:3-deoxy-manno-octulosonate cytidylyltransferase (CMP-KDO synthetase)